MKIINKSNKTVLSKNVIIPKSLITKSLGLLLYKTPQFMLLKTRFGIHTFGLKYAIDVIILDKNYAVCSLKENLNPNNIYIWNPKFEHVLEIPKGIIKKNKIQIGTILEFVS